MNNIGFLVLFFSLGALYFYVGLRASKKVKSDLDYFVADRSLGTLQVSCNLIATQLGGGLLLGTAATAYTSGLNSLCYPIGLILGFLILGSGIAERLQEFKAVTTAQLLEMQYGSKILKSIASILSIGTLFGILVAQVVCLKSLMTSLGYSSWISDLFWMIVTVYTVVGGMRAISINDLIQLGIISVTFFGLFFFNVITLPDSIPQLFKAYQDGIFPKFTIGSTDLISVILVPALFCLIEQDMAQRFFASKTKSVARRSALIAAVYMILFSLIPVYFGMSSRLSLSSLPEGSNPLLVYLQANTFSWIYMIAICAIFAAIISTADALINGISANITQDFDWSENLKKRFFLSPKFISLASGVTALVASYYVPQNVINILISSYELSVCGLLIPLLSIYFKWSSSRTSAFLSIICGISTFLILTVLSYPTFRVLIALASSGAGFLIGRAIPALSLWLEKFRQNTADSLKESNG